MIALVKIQVNKWSLWRELGGWMLEVEGSMELPLLSFSLGFLTFLPL